MTAEKLSNLDIYIVACSDASELFSASCLYLICASKDSNISKTQLITSCSKLQAPKEQVSENEDHIASVPKNETYAAYLASTLMLKFVEIMQKQDIPIKQIFLFIDAISTIIGLSNHPGRYKNPHSRWLAMRNFNLFKCGNLVNQPK